MAIPITCPGCAAAFEVPDNLAGKTIRCTSCKTQLTVTAAAATGSGVAKKPFGWANTPAATPEPLPLDDEPAPAAKPATVARAVPAARPVAKAVSLDDDENEKTRPSKAANKTAAKAATRRRDDDDEDDDDDQPRRKKKNQSGGSGAMIALIAVGVLGLAGIVGASVYFLTGDDEKKKDDTAKSNSSPPPSGILPVPGQPGGPGGPPPGMGGGPPGGGGRPGRPTPGGGPGRPGGGGFGAGSFGGLQGVETLGTSGAWAAYSGDGFTVDFPGTPTTMNVTEAGMSMKVTGVANKSEDSATVVISATLPPEAQSADPKQILNAAVSSGQIPGAGPARDVTLNGFPGKEIDVTDGDASGTLRMFVAKDRMFIFIAGGKSVSRESITRFFNSAKITYQAGGGGVAIGGPPGGGSDIPGGFDPPGSPGSGGGPPPGMGPGVPPGGGSSGPGGFVPPGAPGSGGPPPGMGPGTPPGGGGGRPPGPGGPGGFVPPGAPGSGGPPPGMGPPGGGFPPGGGGGDVAGGGRPPGPGGGIPGQPGGGQVDSNPPPFGVNTDGNLKASVDPFYAAAFDVEKKEFYTVSPRDESTAGRVRVYGWLKRYSYPNFSDRIGFKIPSMGTRVALDSPKGLLYVATVRTPNAEVGQQHIDHASAAGDIHVFDLNAIRAGKVEDGTELKPIATLPIASGKAVRGMELFDDGKSLVVMTTTTGRPYKSQVIKIDTETRKATATKDLPEGGWDMCKSADGKSLLITEMPAGASKVANIRVYDAANMVSVKTHALGGPANDLAPANGGQIAATVQGVGGSNKVVLLSEKNGWRALDVELGIGWKAANNGYAQFSPDGKLLFVSSHRAKGLDVYEVTDPDAPTGLKKKASILTAGGKEVGGHVYVSPDGDYLVDHHGVVLATANIGGSNGETGGGMPIGGGVPPGGIPPGGGLPPGGVPPGGAMPPGGGIPLPPPPGAAGGGGMPGGIPLPPPPGAAGGGGAPGGGIPLPPPPGAAGGGGAPGGGARPPGGGAPTPPPPGGDRTGGRTDPPAAGGGMPPGGSIPLPPPPGAAGGGAPPKPPAGAPGGGSVPPGGGAVPPP